MAFLLTAVLQLGAPVDTLPARAGVEETSRKRGELESAVLESGLDPGSASALLRDIRTASAPRPQSCLIRPAVGCGVGLIAGLLIGSAIGASTPPSSHSEDPAEALADCLDAGGAELDAFLTTVFATAAGGLGGCALGVGMNQIEGGDRVTRYRLQVNILVRRYNNLISPAAPDSSGAPGSRGID